MRNEGEKGRGEEKERGRKGEREIEGLRDLEAKRMEVPEFQGSRVSRENSIETQPSLWLRLAKPETLKP